MSVARLLAILAALAISAYVALSTAQAQTRVHRAWVPAGLARPTGGSFTINMPVGFRDVEVTVDDGGNGHEVGYLLSGRTSEGVKFIAMELLVPMPVKPITSFLDDMKARPGAVVSEVADEKDTDRETLSFRFEDGKSGAYMRMIRLPEVGYSQTIEYPLAAREQATALQPEFFASFRIAPRK